MDVVPERNRVLVARKHLFLETIEERGWTEMNEFANDSVREWVADRACRLENCVAEPTFRPTRARE